MSGRSMILVVFEETAERLRHALLPSYVSLERRKTLAQLVVCTSNIKNTQKKHISGDDVDDVLLAPERELLDDFGPIWVSWEEYRSRE